MGNRVNVDLILHIARTDGRVQGIVSGPSRASEPFDGWLDLTAAIARALDSPAPVVAAGHDQPTQK